MAAAIAFVSLWPHDVSAHLQVAQGRLFDLVQRSDRVLIAKVRGIGDARGGRRELDVVILSPDASSARRGTLLVPARLGIRPGRAYAFFVRLRGDAWECIHPEGTVFPAPHKGREYVELERTLRSRLPGDVEGATEVVLLALRSNVRELRYHAALVLLDAVHDDHPLDAARRAALRRVLATEDFDPALRSVLEPLGREPAE